MFSTTHSLNVQPSREAVVLGWYIPGSFSVMLGDVTTPVAGAGGNAASHRSV